MKIGLLFLLLFVSTTYSFQCDSLFYGRRCGEYDRASKSLKKIVEKTDDAIDDVYNFLGTESAKLYSTIFEKLGNNVTVVVKGNMTKEEAMALVDKMIKLLKEMTLIGNAAKKDLDKIQQLINEALKGAIGGYGNAYLLLDKLDLEELKNFVSNSLSGMNSIVRTLIVKAIERAHGRLESLGSLIEPIANTFGLTEQYKKIKDKIHELAERAKNRVGGSTYKIEQQIDEAKKDVSSFIDSFKQGAIVKRGISDLWQKVEEALDKLGDNVKKSAKELVEKYKPKILSALGKVKKIILNGTRSLILELKGDIIDILTEDKKDKRSVYGLWDKVKDAVKNLAGNIQDGVNKILEANKPVIEKALGEVKKVVIDGAKKVVIEINNNIVRILTGDEAEKASTHYSPYVIIDQSKKSSLYGFGDVWNKLKAKVQSLGDKIKAKTKVLIEKYKPKILKTIQEVKQFVIDEGQKIIIELKGDLIQIIIKEAITEAISGTTPPAADETEKDVAKRSLSDTWNKIKAAAKRLRTDIKDRVSKIITDFKPKIVEALQNVGKVVIEGAKKVIIEVNNGIVSILTDGQTATSDGSLYHINHVQHSVYVTLDDSTPATYGLTDIWSKVKQTVGILKYKLSAKAKQLIEKYKFEILKSLNKVKEVVIDEGRKLIIKITGDLVEIIEITTDEIKKGITKRSITDYWTKIKEAAKKLGSDIKDKVSKVINEHKSKVLDALDTVKKVVIDGAKKVVIEVNNGIVSILTDGQTATSDGSFYAFDDVKHSAYVVIDNSSPSTYAFSDIWAKVKTTVTGLKDKLSARAKELIEKYKVIITNSLNKVKEFVIDEGKKIVIKIKGDIVEIIESTTDEIKSGITKRSITDYWTKIKEAAKKLGSDIKDKVSKVINEHKSKVLDALNTVKKVVIDGAKKVVIEVNNGIVSILTDGQTATSDGSFYTFDDVKHSAYVVIDNSSPSTYAFSDIWAKVKTTVTGLKDKLSARAKELIEKYKVIITNSLNKVKEFVIDEGKKIVIKIKGDIVEIIESTTDEIKSGITKRSITDYWTKIKEAAKKLGSDIKDKVSKVINEHKSKVLDALNTVKKVVIDGAKKVVIEVNNGIVSILTDGQTATSDGSFYTFDDVKHSAYVVIDNSSPSTYAFRDIWAKVKTTVTGLKDKLSARAKELIEKYKVIITNSLNKVKEFVIDEGKKIVIKIKGDIVEIIESTTDEIKSGITKRSITDYWTKIKEAAKKLGSDIKDKVSKVINEHKSKVLDALNTVKKVVIDGAKKVVIEVNNGIVSILTDGQTATSDGSFYAFDDVKHSAYVVIDNSSPSTYAFSDIWAKVKTTVTGLKDKLSARAKELIEKYKVIITNSLNKVKEFVIDEGKKIVIKIKGDIVEIIESTTDEIKSGITKRSITDYWTKIKEAAKKLGSDIKDKVSKVINEHKSKVLDALNTVKKVVIDGAKKVVIEVNNGIVSILTDGQTATSDGSFYAFDDVKHSAYVVIDNSSPSTYAFSDIWAKVKTTVTGLKDKLSARAKELIEKYKVIITNSLNKVKEFVIDEGKKIVIKIKGDIVEIIESTTDEIKSGITKRSITDYWTKIKEAAKKLGSDIKDKVSKVITEHKSKVLDALNTVKKVVIDGAKKVVIEVNNGIVSILTDGQTATSDGSFYAFDDAKHSVYVVIDNSSPSTYAFSDIWAKVKNTVSILKDKLSAKAKELIEKYKLVIKDSLNRVKEVVIDEGKKLIIKIKGDVVEIIESTTDEIKSGVTKRSITDYWNKIKEAAKKLGSDIKDKVTKVITEHKSKVLDALNTVKKVVIDGAKKVVIEVNNGIVSILTDGQTATSDGSFYDFSAYHDIYVVIDDSRASLYGITDVWEKVKTAVGDLKSDIKDRVMGVIQTYKPKVIAALNNFQTVVIDGAKKIVIEINGHIVKVITEGLEGLSS